MDYETEQILIFQHKLQLNLRNYINTTPQKEYRIFYIYLEYLGNKYTYADDETKNNITNITDMLDEMSVKNVSIDEIKNKELLLDLLRFFNKKTA